MAFSKLLRVNVTVNGETTVTSQQSSVTYDGVTFTFDREMPVGTFVTGEPFVVSDQAFQITSISPESVSLNGYQAHGAMLNPDLSTNVQGFDEFLQHFDRNGDTPSNDTATIPYDGALNIDPTVNGAVSVAAQQKVTVVKSVRSPSKVSVTGWRHIDRYVALTVLDASPPKEAYTPGWAGTTKTLRTRSDIDFTPRGYALPASFGTVQSLIDAAPTALPPLSSNGEKRRTLRVDTTTSSGYSGEIADDHAKFLYALNSSAPTIEQREAMISRVIGLANQLEAAIDTGVDFKSGAGQGGGIWLWGLAAAALLKDDVLHQKIRNAGLQPESPFWIDASQVGLPAPGKSGSSGQTMFAEDVGAPMVNPDHYGSNHSGRYVEIAGEIISWEVAAILAFNQGPVGFANGLEMILNGGPNDDTNPKAAMVAFMFRRRTWQPNFASGYDVDQDFKDAVDQIASFPELDAWTGKPDRPPRAVVDTGISAGNASIRFALPSGYSYATEPITQWDFRHSLDGIQWVVSTDVALPFTANGLIRGMEHQVGVRTHSASGASGWSGNFPSGGGDLSGRAARNVATPTGAAASAAPDYSGGTLPRVHKRLHPAWTWSVYEEVSGLLTKNDVLLAAGVGYPSAYPGPTFSYQWEESAVGGGSGFSDIVGATDAAFQAGVLQEGKFLRCRVTAANGVGSPVVEYTNEVQRPATVALPAGTLIDTDFKGAFSVDYASEVASITSSGGTGSHSIPGAPVGDSRIDPGAFFLDKTGGNPQAEFTLSRSAEVSTVYDISYSFAIAWANSTAAGFFEVVDGTDTVLLSREISPSGDVQPFEEFTFYSPAGSEVRWGFDSGSMQFATGANTSLRIRLRVATGTGGISGGDMYLNQLWIRPA